MQRLEMFFHVVVVGCVGVCPGACTSTQMRSCNALMCAALTVHLSGGADSAALGGLLAGLWGVQ